MLIKRNNMQNKDYKDNTLKDLFAASKIEAKDNLKYRIMQQIRTEHSLKRVNVQEKKINMQISNLLKIGGCVYLLIAFIALFVFICRGKEALLTSEFLVPSVFVVFVGIVWCAISYLDTSILCKGK